MRETYVGELMCHMIKSTHGLNLDDVKDCHFTANGAVAIFEYGGEFYRLNLEHMQGARAEQLSIAKSIENDREFQTHSI